MGDMSLYSLKTVTNIEWYGIILLQNCSLDAMA